MSHYSLLVSLHVASVIVWVGCSTSLALFAIPARRAGIALGELGALTWWMTLWVLVPASLAAPGFGVLAAHAGHWPDIFFFHVGEGAFLFSFLLTVTVRLPLLRRGRRGKVSPARLPRYLAALALAELTVLYVAVADMATKPSGFGSTATQYGSGIVVVGLLSAAGVWLWARRSPGLDQSSASLEALRPMRSS